MKEMNELTELYQRGDEVEESSIDTTTNNVHPNNWRNPKNVIVNTNTIDEMVICEETGLKYAMPSANKKSAGNWWRNWSENNHRENQDWE